MHHVFHISQLKPVIGEAVVASELPTVMSRDDEVLVEPEEIVDTRYDDLGYLEVLAKWKNLPQHETS